MIWITIHERNRFIFAGNMFSDWVVSLITGSSYLTTSIRILPLTNSTLTSRRHYHELLVSTALSRIFVCCITIQIILVLRIMRDSIIRQDWTTLSKDQLVFLLHVQILPKTVSTTYHNHVHNEPSRSTFSRYSQDSNWSFLPQMWKRRLFWQYPISLVTCSLLQAYQFDHFFIN